MIDSDTPPRTRILSIAEIDSDRPRELLIVGVPTVSLLTGGTETCVLMFVRNDVVLGREDSGLLQTLFSLTPAETNIAVDLANGRHLDDICTDLGIKKNTARAHLRSIFLKMGHSRQVEMVHALSSSVIPLGRLTPAPDALEIVDMLYEPTVPSAR